MKILCINPNSSSRITERISQTVKKLENETLNIDVIRLEDAPPAIVTLSDELIAGMKVVEKLKDNENQYDAGVIACFADPGLYVAREECSIPVAGLYESSAAFARMTGFRYSIIASGNETDISPWVRSVRALGDENHVASIRYVNSSVEEAANIDENEIIKQIDICKKNDGVDSIILGCAAFAGLGKRLSELTGMHVIDGMEESIRFVEMQHAYRKGR